MDYALPPGVSFCLVGDQAIFLDVRHDRYFGLEAHAQSSFLKLVDRLALAPLDTDRLDRLGRTGILAKAPAGAGLQPCPAPAAPTASYWEHANVSPRGRQVIGSLLDLGSSRLALRFRSLHGALRHMQTRKAAVRPAPLAVERIQSVVAAFQRAALLVSPHNQCLPQSIAVVRALARQQVSADLVLGVKLHPFRAHCWVQAGSSVVNDRVDRVRDFTPILVV